MYLGCYIAPARVLTAREETLLERYQAAYELSSATNETLPACKRLAFLRWLVRSGRVSDAATLRALEAPDAA